MSYVPMPIIIENTKECMMVDGKRFCEDFDVSPKEIGFVLIFIGLFFLWAIFLVWLSNKFDNDLILIFGIIGSIFAGGFWLII